MQEAEKETELVHCVYCSAESTELSKDEILDILKIARSNNGRLGVSGMLLYESGAFFQVIEGEKDTIAKLFEAISKDRRHKNISKIIYEPIEKRSFSSWTMGFSELSREELNKIDGLNDFFTGSKCLLDIDKGRAKDLLRAFSNGKWRAKLR